MMKLLSTNVKYSLGNYFMSVKIFKSNRYNRDTHTHTKKAKTIMYTTPHTHSHTALRNYGNK